jgi:hypothetical protein
MLHVVQEVPVYPVEQAKQAAAVEHDLHLVLITVQVEHTPLSLKKPAEQVAQSAPVNPEEQTKQEASVVHWAQFVIAAEHRLHTPPTS